MTTKFVVTDEQDRKFHDRVWELENRWRKNILDPEPTLKSLQSLIENEQKIVTAKSSNILKLISGGKAIIIDAVDGVELLTDARDVFSFINIGSDVENSDVNEPGRPTVETPVDVHRMVMSATFAQMFGELNADARKLCLTQAQIKKFANKHSDWLKKGGDATFFLFESKGRLFVAHMYFDHYPFVYLRLNIRCFEFSHIWLATDEYRVVVPQSARSH